MDGRINYESVFGSIELDAKISQVRYEKSSEAVSNNLNICRDCRKSVTCHP